MTKFLIIYGFIAVALVFLHLVRTRSRKPETLYLVYTAVVTLGVVALFAYNVAGAITTQHPLRGSYIGTSILSGLFAAGMLWATLTWYRRFRRS